MKAIYFLSIFIYFALCCGANLNNPVRKFWIVNCLNSECINDLNTCIDLKCGTEKQCVSCVEKINPNCKECSESIYSPNEMAHIDGSDYFLCDNSIDLYLTGCSFYCRGKYRSDGYCYESSSTFNFQYCKCYGEIVTSHQASTTNQPTTSLFLK